MKHSKRPRPARSFLTLAAVYWLRSGGALLLLLLLSSAAHAAGYLGIFTAPSEELPPTASLPVNYGVTVIRVIPGSPAEAAGLRESDVLWGLDGVPLGNSGEEARAGFQKMMADTKTGQRITLDVFRDFSGVVEGGVDPSRSAPLTCQELDARAEQLTPGQSLPLTLKREVAVLHFSAILTDPPEIGAIAGRSDSELHPQLTQRKAAAEIMAEHAAARFGFQERYSDLRQRLAKLGAAGDWWRLDEVSYALRQPFQLEETGAAISELFLPRKGPAAIPDLRQIIAAAGEILGAPPTRAEPVTLPVDAGLAAFAQGLETGLSRASETLERAFAALSTEERAFLKQQIDGISAAMLDGIYLHGDEDPRRLRDNLRAVELTAKIDLAALLSAGQQLAQLADAAACRTLRTTLAAAGVDLTGEYLLRQETAAGEIIIGGTGPNIYRNMAPAIIIDLGGDDIYAAGPAETELPPSPALTLIVDLAGDDAYEATGDYAQAVGVMGASVLLECAGDDTYIGQNWAQGCGALGVGLLADLDGNDTYRGQALNHGAGWCGLGLLWDGRGNDRYDAFYFAQGLGWPRGLGLLIDVDGTDAYYAKGRHPTNYGTQGVFDAWAQGCGMGFRGHCSGGIGVLIDGGGADRMEAGNFAQGGGYYFGWGILDARGGDSDAYIGSRYNQGFCAHQAAGTFLERGGNDSYTTRHAVAPALAWDECVTLFRDYGGSDSYHAGGFSLGASAHNAICVFIDDGGGDTYIGTAPALAGPNDYHGGSSLSLFFDLGGGNDTFPGGFRERMVAYRELDGVFFALPGSLDKEIAAERWTTMTVPWPGDEMAGTKGF